MDLNYPTVTPRVYLRTYGRDHLIGSLITKLKTICHLCFGTNLNFKVVESRKIAEMKQNADSTNIEILISTKLEANDESSSLRI
jgi:hypothetical protein